MFTAVILVCLLATPVDSCRETTAVDVIHTTVDSELRCTHGWQEMLSRGALREGGVYEKMVCRRQR